MFSALRLASCSLEALISNQNYEKQKNQKTSVPDIKTPKAERIFIKVSDVVRVNVQSLTRLSLLHPGNAEIIFFDLSSGKYSAVKGVKINPDESVLAKLYSTYGEKNVVLK